MRGVILNVLTLMLLSATHVAADDKPFPFRLAGNIPFSTGWGFDVRRITLSALEDLTVVGIQINRGNCYVAEPHVPNDKRLIAPRYPLTWKFGVQYSVWTAPNCELLEIVVQTEQGNYKLTITP